MKASPLGWPWQRQTLNCASRGQNNLTHLSIVHHVDALEDYVLGVVSQEVQDVFDLGLVGQAPKPNAVFSRSRSDYVLRQ